MCARSRFTLERELGHGGEGRVVAVRDAARAGAVVALKETHGASATNLAREFELLATLKHRHLAEVYDYFARSPLGGERAAYTQVLVSGRDFYRTGREHPALLSELVGQLLRALAQLHAAGLVHLDLKPDNVLVELEPQPRARLVDFGIAARIGSRPDVVRGSRSYVAPEVLAGEPVRPGADLFALGVALAEIALGSAQASRALGAEPFERRREALVDAGMEPAPAELAATLVAAERSERPATAAEAARIWGRLGKRSLALVTPASATGLVRSGGLVARAAEKRAIRGAIAERRLLRVGGPPASGRSALFDSALREAQLAGYVVERWPLVDATATVDGFRAALGRLVDGADALDPTPPPAEPAGPEAWAQALRSVAGETLERLLGLEPPTPPAALFVRDPESAPAPVRALLTAMGDHPGTLPLAIVLGAAPGEAIDLELGPVGADEVRAFVASRFGPEVAAQDALISALASSSGGLLGHLEALSELLVAQRSLVLRDEGWTLEGEPWLTTLSAPREEAVARRLALLEADERATLTALATLSIPGRAVAAEVIEAALGLDALGDAVEDLVAFGLIRRDAGGRLALGHRDLTRALPSLELGATARERVLACGALDDELRARLEGGRRGARLALRVARDAIAASSLEDAERACRLALDLAGAATSPERLDALAVRAEIADRLGPRGSQLAALRALIEALDDSDPRRLSAEARLFWTLTRMGDPGFETRGEALVARALEADRPLLAAEVAVHLAIVATQRGEQDRAERLLVNAREGLGGQSAPLALSARISNNLGNVYAYRGDHARALEAYREAHRLKIEEGDPVGERIALGNMALMELELGEPARALEDLAASYALARRTRHRRGQAWSLLTMAEIGLVGASPRYASRRAEAAAELAHELGDQLVEGDARATLAEALLQLDERDRAEREARRGEALATAAENAWTTRRARAVALLAGDPRGPCTEGLEAIVADAEADATTRQLAARHLAEVALVRGDTARAQAAIDRVAALSSISRGGVRWAELLHTRARVRQALGAGDVVAESRAALERLAAWVQAWPEAPRPDGVDEIALSEGPCRATVLAHPAIAALLVKQIPVDTAASRSSDRESEEPYLVEHSDGLANADATELERRLTRALTDLVRLVDAERAVILRKGERTMTVIDARDADGEAISDPLKRVPEAALEAAERSAPWRAPGPDNRGAIAIVPWRVPVADSEVRGAVFLQNRFVLDAFSDTAASARAVGTLALVLRLVVLERALAEERSRSRDASLKAEAVERRTTEEIRNLRRELESTREQLGPARDYDEIVFVSKAMKKMLRQVDRVISTDLPVHIRGESGTGKELVARAIHQLGGRSRGPFVPQNCTAIPPTLFESELFGHERGAFTGATRSNEGLFRRANGGTLFLDEIGDLPLELQAKLLRILETGEVRPVGATRSISVDVRIVSATHRDLTELVEKKAFREDLYYRLNVIRIDIPALRDRPEDIPVLVDHFLSLGAHKNDRILGIDEDALRALVRFSWPGNVRQLENEVARASLLADGGLITLRDLSDEVANARPREAVRGAGGGDTLDSLGLAHGPLRDRVDRLESLVLEQTLKSADGNKSEVARVLGLSRAGLNLKLKRLGLWDS